MEIICSKVFALLFMLVFNNFWCLYFAIFLEFKKETWAERFFFFQEAIALRFGFMPVYTETKMGSNEVSLDRQYVHCSGHMFMLIASPNQALKIRQRLASGGTMKKPSFLNRF